MVGDPRAQRHTTLRTDIRAGRGRDLRRPQVDDVRNEEMDARKAAASPRGRLRGRDSLSSGDDKTAGKKEEEEEEQEEKVPAALAAS